MIGLVAVTAAGRRAAASVAEAWPEETRHYPRPVADALRQAWGECDQVVAFLAVGAAVRLVAPLLHDKHTDPGLVCVDEGRRHAVAVLGGHAGGANALTHRLSAVLGTEPVVTTATDATAVPGLDTLGWPVEGAVAAVTRAVLDGTPVRLASDATWPLPALPANVGEDGEMVLAVTDRELPLDGRTAVLRPPSLVLGVGSSRGVAAEEVLALVDAALAEAGLSPASVGVLATVDLKADEEGILEAARSRGWAVEVHPAAVLAEVEVPNPSAVVAAEVGTASVAEAAALVTAGSGAELLVHKQKSPMATVAVARRRPRGRLAVVGLGPGARDLLTPRAAEELARASVVVGLDQYLDQVRDLLRPGATVLASGLGDEEARARTAVEQAQLGHAVALIGSGDAGVYAMASPALDVAGDDIDVVGVPGITAALAASALLGAPLGHDTAYVSLSDLHTPWEAIERRLRACADGDFVVVFYNPRSRQRDWQLGTALEILLSRRPSTTPVGVVRNASRSDEAVIVSTLADLDPADVDMYSLVVVGSSNTRMVAGRMVTPRGYKWQR
ncbi:cobalt-precorrin 5A hydrolase/precorrin-3B C17-methyltransferase [Motilibacter rhizosphaerae]|uniref:Cobalt-precorrin 5A hydrolase/precorrin-3B C17-methyltransferase n=1 Tax=Motilibacter rhizosphaerae TaxID=598652 RepID=A0A4Q7NSK6_9ACTN|nr:precorrin-3B C(17)-methyltransferase [Motilibacter rhizosphaerae]RZS89840.1 cobalt-precorrin 5A hydrolase/precorrin-3B C17-methyltransferase [Motilibacter rhizosphaerae]